MSRSVVAFLLFCAFAEPVHAIVVVPLSPTELTNASSLIVYGRVAGVREQWSDDRRHVDSVVTLDVIEAIKGSPGERVVFASAGGRMGRYRDYIPGAPVFAEGDLMVVYLTARGARLPVVTGFTQGIHRVEPESAPASRAAYLKLGTAVGDRIVSVKWRQQPIRYFVSDQAAPGVSSADLRGAVQRAVATWQAVPSALVRFEFAGTTSVEPGLSDARNTIGFLDRSDLDRTLGSTSFLIDEISGSLVEADILFNTRFRWSVSPQGETGRIDLETVALHEIGHLIGLSHSALGETERDDAGGRRVTASGAVMFPIAMAAGTVADRALQPDDIAGVSDLYPAPGTDTDFGAVMGRVVRNGRGVFLAHVVAANLETGALVGGFTLTEAGEFVIGKLVPGLYVVRVEPLDDADAESFFSMPIDTGFRVTFAPKLIVVPRGGAFGSIEISVNQ